MLEIVDWYFLGTTSLYSVGSSQYNRIKVPMSDTFTLQFKRMGITEGYGTVYFSKETTGMMMRLLELQDGGRRINNILARVLVLDFVLSVGA